MRIILIFILFCIAGYQSFAQIIENFDDGNIDANPVWEGDTSDFAVNTSKQLRLESAGADTSCITTANNRIYNTEWNLWLKMSFNTSANNFCRVYLASDQQNLRGNLNGYYIQVGGASDSVVLYRQEGTHVIALLTAGTVCTNHSTNILRIKVKHELSGSWSMLIDPFGENNFVLAGSCIDSAITFTSYFGLYCRYTSSNSAKFYFDDIFCGTIQNDTIPPAVNKVKVLEDSEIEMTFSEPVTEESASAVSNFSTALYGSPSSAIRDSLNASKILLQFSAVFSTKFSDTITVRNIKDNAGNVMEQKSFEYFQNKPDSYEIVIDEIMADPDPSVSLPLSEYIELFNRGNLPADLTNWQLEYGSSKKILPEVVIQPKSFLIITKDNFMGIYGSYIDLFTSSTSLSNEGTLLVLKNEEGKIIHSIDYKNAWYNDAVKEEGGWSLEMIDAGNPCGCGENWSGSKNGAGGTPGSINSVAANNPDTARPYIKGIRMEGDSGIIVIYSESMDSTTLAKWKMEEEDLASKMIPPSFKEEKIALGESLNPGSTYQIKFSGGTKDCAGNIITGNETWIIAVPDTVKGNDIVVNEVLPDPFPGGSRFIEIFNRSEKILDLRDLVLCAFDSVSQGFEDLKNISEESQLFFPGKFVVLTNDPEDIFEKYNCPYRNNFISLTSLPSMTNEYADLMLIRKNDGFIIDRMKYNNTMFFPLIDDPSGVSLEKVNPDGPSAENDNWHSASFSCGYATPGYQNSQYIQPVIATSLMNIDKPVFSPDNDGFNDILSISVSSEDPLIISLKVYDLEGRLIRSILSNKIPSRNDWFFWDGIDETGKKASAGTYVVYLEAISKNGEVKKEMKPVVLAEKF